jgi:hypothetical protein
MFDAVAGGAVVAAEGAAAATGAAGETDAGKATAGSDGADVAGALSGTARWGVRLTV